MKKIVTILTVVILALIFLTINYAQQKKSRKDKKKTENTGIYSKTGKNRLDSLLVSLADYESLKRKNPLKGDENSLWIGDTIYIDLLNNISKEYTNIDPKISMNFANKANTLSLQSKYIKGEINSLIALGGSYFRQFQSDKVLDCGEKAMSLAIKQNDSIAIGYSLLLKGKSYAVKKDFDKFKDNYDKALEIFIKMKSVEG